MAESFTLIAGCIAAAVCVGFLVYALMPKQHAESEAIDRRLEADDAGRGKKQKSGGRPDMPKKPSPQLMDAVRKAAPKIAAPMSEEDQSRLRKKLSTAGIRGDSAPVVFLASKSILGLGAAAVALFFTVVVPFVGVWVPRWSRVPTGTATSLFSSVQQRPGQRPPPSSVCYG